MLGTALGWIDDRIAPLPAVLRLLLWGGACGAASMGIYALVSPQRALAELGSEAREARAAITTYDGDFSGAMPLLRRRISLALRAVGLTLLPTIAAALPPVAAALWLAGRYGDRALLAGAPPWLAGWEAPFIAAALAVSLAIKLLGRIH